MHYKVAGKQDPFCVFRLGETAKRTKTDYRGGSRPIWDDQVRVNGFYLMNNNTEILGQPSCTRG